MNFEYVRMSSQEKAESHSGVTDGRSIIRLLCRI